MKGFKLALIALVLWILVVFIIWLGVSERGLQWIYQYSAEYLPAGLHIEQVEGRLASPIVLKKLSYQAADGSSYSSDQLTVKWNLWALIEGRFDIESLLLTSLSIDKNDSVTSSDTVSESAQKIQLPDIQLPLSIRLHKMQVDNIRFTKGDESWHLPLMTFSGSTLFNQLTINQLLLKSEFSELTSSGVIRLAGNYKHQLQFNWKHQLAEGKNISGQGSLTGNTENTQLSHKVSGVLKVDLQAQLSKLLDDFQWQADLAVSQFDSRNFTFVNGLSDIPAVKAKFTLSGSGNLKTQKLQGRISGSNTELGPFTSSFDLNRLENNLIKIKQVTLNAEKSETHLQAQGDWLPDNQFGRLNLAVNWQHLKWPLSGHYWFSSASGKARFIGNPDNYKINVESDRPWPQIPDSQWQLSAKGNQYELNIDSLKVKTLQGELSAQGKLDWKDFFNWDAKIVASGINPAKAWPEWPGLLSANIKTQGYYRQNNLVVKSEILDLKGRLRDYPVFLNGKLEWNDNQLLIEQIKLKSANSLITTEGKLADSLALQWTIVSPDLAELYPSAGGILNASGKISGSRQEPALKIDFDASDLSWDKYQIKAAEGSAQFDLKKWYQGELSLNTQSITVGEEHFNSANISTQGESILLNVKSDLGMLDVKLKGNVKDDSWQGKLLSVDLNSERFSNWHLSRPVELSFNENSFKAEKLCLENEQQGNVCSLFQQLDKNIQAKLKIDRLPLNLFQAWMPPNISPEGDMNATANLILSVNQKVTGNVQLTFDEGIIHYPVADTNVEKWPFRQGVVDISLTEEGIQLKSKLEVNQHDNLRVQVLLPQAQLLKLNQQQPLQASVQLNIIDIRLLGALIPEVQQANGIVTISLHVKGTLEKPELNGYVNLERGSFKIPRLGLDIEKLSLVSQTDDFDNMNFELRAHSGEGEIVAKGYVALNNGSDWKCDFKVTGKDFEVSKIPEARVRVSPDLNVMILPKLIDIKGKVHVPYARLNPRDISSADQVSEDVVIIGNEKSKDKKWTITSEVRLTLDDKHVQFYGFGFEGRIGGSLLLEDSPGRTTRATGDIRVPEGRYRAYGQRLTINDGRLLFTGGPVTNPGLDFRAVRVIEDVTAGLKVSGTLLKPQLEIFSIPAMGQTDALSYLVLGRPMETTSSSEGALVTKAALALGLSGGEQIARVLGDSLGLDEVRVESSEDGEQASLVVGRYLSPKLYISYGVGLIESINTFGLRYQLSSKWQLKAESGEAQGADLLYTIER